MLRDRLLDALQPSGLMFRLAAEAQWQQTRLPGVEIRTLFHNPQTERVTVCVRMAAGAVYPGHLHHMVEECLVLEGDLRVGDITLGPGDYQAALPGSKHPRQRTTNGCLLLLTLPAADLALTGAM
jgi:anti-sigma factor ChrR (cupin superfamily)